MPTPWPQPLPSMTTTGTAAAALGIGPTAVAAMKTAPATRSAARGPPLRTSSLLPNDDWGASSRHPQTLHVAPESLEPASGWGVLHLFCKFPTAGAAGAAGVDAEAVVTAVKSAEAAGVQVVTFAVLGHKADVGVMALAPDLWRLRELQTGVQQAGLEV